MSVYVSRCINVYLLKTEKYLSVGHTVADPGRSGDAPTPADPGWYRKT